MTNNKEREFEEIMDKIFGTEPSRYSAWNKELFLQMFNEAYAKGRQSVLDKIPNEQLVDTEILKILKLDFTHTYSLKVFYKWLISKLSDDKGG